MEENNQDLNSVGMEEQTPVTPEMPAEAAPVEPVAPEVAPAMPEATPVEATPAVPEMPAEAAPVEPAVPEVAPAMPEATPVEATPAVPEMPAEAAPVEPAVPEVAPAMPEATPVEATPAAPEMPAEAAPVEPVAPAVAPAMPVAPAAEEVAPVEVATLPVVDPVPAVESMPEGPAAPAPEVPVDTTPGTPEIVTAEPTPAGYEEPVEKKGKGGTIILVLLLLAAIGAAVYFFLIKGKDEPKPTPTPTPTPSVTVRPAKYFKSGASTAEIVLYEDDNTFVFLKDETTYTGSYVFENNQYTLTVGNVYLSGTCNASDGTTVTLLVDEEGNIYGQDGLVQDVKMNTSTSDSATTVSNFQPTSCEPAPTEEPNETVEEPNETTEEPNETAATVEVESVTLDKTENELLVGKNFKLVATVTPDNATDKKVTWSTSNKKIATVKDGKVTAVKAGTATITATTSNGKKAECVVTVKEEEKQEEQQAFANCPYKEDGDDVRKENGDLGDYNRFKKDLNDIGKKTGIASAKQCKTLAEIIADIKAAVKAEAEKCWPEELVTKAVESAECKLTPECDKTSKYGGEAIFEKSKENSIVSIWTETQNCPKTDADYHL